MNPSYDKLIKIVILGNHQVGKSSFLLRFTDDTFNQSYISTIGLDFRFITISLGNLNVKMQLWDLSGDERFKTIINQYFNVQTYPFHFQRELMLSIVYDVTNKESFEAIGNHWIQQIQTYGKKNSKILGVGNKADLDTQKESVPTNQAIEFCEANKLMFVEGSAKTGDMVNEAFRSLAISMLPEDSGYQLSEQSTNISIQRYLFILYLTTLVRMIDSKINSYVLVNQLTANIFILIFINRFIYLRYS